MDLNYLFHRHQVATMMGDATACPAARVSHRAMAVGYARRIADWQEVCNVAVPFVSAAA